MSCRSQQWCAVERERTADRSGFEEAVPDSADERWSPFRTEKWSTTTAAVAVAAVAVAVAEEHATVPTDSEWGERPRESLWPRQLDDAARGSCVGRRRISDCKKYNGKFPKEHVGKCFFYECFFFGGKVWRAEKIRCTCRRIPCHWPSPWGSWSAWFCAVRRPVQSVQPRQRRTLLRWTTWRWWSGWPNVFASVFPPKKDAEVLKQARMLGLMNAWIFSRLPHPCERRGIKSRQTRLTLWSFEWLVDWLIGWLSVHQMIDWLIDWLINSIFGTL